MLVDASGAQTFAELVNRCREAAARGVPVPVDIDVTLDPTTGRLRVGYDADLFEPDTVDRLARHVAHVLARGTADPGARLDDLPLPDPTELEQLVRWSRGEPAPAVRDSLWDLFARQVRRRPEAVAVVAGDRRITYRELADRSERLAARLLARGCRHGDRVGLRVERTADLVVGVLGILRAGCAYVPLDPSYPADRLSFMTADARLALVADADLLGHDDDGDLTVPDVTSTAADLAYLIYTSGSTGRPKAVTISHGHVVRLLTGTDEWFGFGPQDVWTLFHSLSFDFSVWEIWGALAYGGRLVVVPHWVSRSPEAFHDLLRQQRVTVLNQTPAAFRQLAAVDADRGRLADLRTVVFGGDALDTDSVRRWLRRYGPTGPRLVNMYGITETTVHVTYCPLSTDLLDAGGSLIGVPIPDLSAWVLDRAGRPAPVGVPGELLVGGPGVSWGYLNRPGLTAERFTADPYGPPGARRYHSGDLVRRRPDGSLDYLGRIDHQVKIRGFRIELGEIEAALAEHPRIAAACVVVRPHGEEKRLVGYVVPSDGEVNLDLSDVRTQLAARLPGYMVPAALVPVDHIPLTANGKVDRAALPEPTATGRPRAAGGAPRTPAERALAPIWGSVLGVADVARDDDFFGSGGTSLDLTRLRAEIRRGFGVDLDVRRLYADPVFETVARLVDAGRRDTGRRDTGPSDAGSPVIPLATGGTRPPLFVVHAVGGSVAPYLPLARLLTGIRPVYGLDGTEGTLPGSVEELAARYVAAVRRVQPHGPYHLAGWSFGGLVGAEMSYLLERAGETVAHLMLLDTSAGPYPRVPADRRLDLLRRFVADVAGIAGAPPPPLDEATLLTAAPADQDAGVVAALVTAGLVPAGATDELRGRISRFEANWRALAAYRPRASARRVTLVAARDGADPEAWRPLIDARFACRLVDGDHYNVLSEPNVRTVQDELQRSLIDEEQ
ncbi:hypothetical protein GCM10027605_02330 [Micromonospora zhanjiangensis]